MFVVFICLVEVEVIVYGIFMEFVYFYEVGVIDVFVDVVGVCVVIDDFNLVSVVCFLLFVGSGMVVIVYGLLFVFVFVVFELV